MNINEKINFLEIEGRFVQFKSFFMCDSPFSTFIGDGVYFLNKKSGKLDRFPAQASGIR
ncbi:hypothetical protein BLHB2_18740 [Bacillus licheniformis]|nr:hypothetical protein BLHB2_18740 [Bacillus licheniformis]